MRVAPVLVMGAVVAQMPALAGQSALSGEPVHIARASGPITIDGDLGDEGQDIDFANARSGHGATVNLSARLNPTNNVEVQFLQNRRWLSIDAGRVFTANVSRVRGVYTFTSRTFVRVIAQHVSTDRNASLYIAPVADRSADFSTSALFAYKLNWQSVLFVGYGDERELSGRNQLEASSRQFFVKVSYAFQK